MDKTRTARFAGENENSKVVSKFKKDFLHLMEAQKDHGWKSISPKWVVKSPKQALRKVEKERGLQYCLKALSKIKSNDSKFDNSRGSYKHSCCMWCFGWYRKIKFRNIWTVRIFWSDNILGLLTLSSYEFFSKSCYYKYTNHQSVIVGWD